MKILIFANSGYDFVPYSDWQISDKVELFYIIDKVHAESYNHLPNVFSFPNYYGANVELEAYRIAKEGKINVIISRGEKDVLRASKIREMLNLEGLNYSDSLFFRDKILMKEKSLEKNIEIAKYKICDDSLDILEFTNEYGFPTIIKPNLESGSTGVSILKNSKELFKILEDYSVSDFPIIAEEFIKGRLYHIDSLVLHDEYIFSSVSEYTEAPISFSEVPFRGSFTILDGEIKERLEAYARRVIEAFPRSKNAAYHTEIFLTPGGDLVLCETACRMPGARIVTQIEQAYGINLDQEYFLAECGENRNDIIKEIISSNNEISVQLVFYAKKGIIKMIDKTVPDRDWIYEFIINGIEGREYNGAVKSGKGLITVVFSAKDKHDIHTKFEILNSWIDNNIHWEIEKYRNDTV